MLSPDSWGSNQNILEPQTLNSYSYGNGNPISNKDPNGKNAYYYVGAAAYTTSIMWDLGIDISKNLRDPSVPWYLKQSPRGDDAALRYNRDAYQNVAVAESALAAEELALPAVAASAITLGGAKVIGASAAGTVNAVSSVLNGDAYNKKTGKIDPRIVGMNFMSGFIGARIGQTISNPPGRPPISFGASIASARAVTEIYRSQLDQLVQALRTYLTTLQSQQSQPAPTKK